MKTRFHPSLVPFLALALAACPDSKDTGSDSGDGVDTSCPLVTLAFEAALVTIAGAPFGLTYETDAGRVATGSMTYDPCVPDTDTFESPDDGEYDHVATERGAFQLALDGAGTALQITGSTRPMVGIRGLDYFDFEDGGYDVFEEVERTVTVNGVADAEAVVDFTIGGGEVDFATDDLPEVFPMTGTSPDAFDCMSGTDFCVTYAVGESDFGDSFLMELLSLTQTSP